MKFSDSSLKYRNVCFNQACSVYLKSSLTIIEKPFCLPLNKTNFIFCRTAEIPVADFRQSKFRGLFIKRPMIVFRQRRRKAER
jgi:hypothetical protein